MPVSVQTRTQSTVGITTPVKPTVDGILQSPVSLDPSLGVEGDTIGEVLTDLAEKSKEYEEATDGVVDGSLLLAYYILARG